MDLAHLFIDSFDYSAGMSYSDGTYSPTSTASGLGRWEEDYKVISISGGEEKTSTHKLGTTVDIPLNGLVWGPLANSANRGEALRVLGRKYARTLDGTFSYFIYRLGR